MEITADKINDSFIIYDIRDSFERNYGFIPGSVSVTEEELLNISPTDGKEILIVCASGENSLLLANKLSSKGIKAYSLKGGYPAYLRYITEKNSNTDICQRCEQSLRKKFKKSIMNPFYKALKLYKLVNEGDKVAVCMSGGKDSFLMAKLFQELKRYSEVSFDVEYMVMDPGYSTVNRQIIEKNAEALEIPIKIFEADIFRSVFNIEKSPCYLCARMRRGYLYKFAKGLGCNKIALGHHYDDVIETVLMGMLYSGQMQSMMPKLHSENYEGMELIRPLYFIREADIKAWRDYNGLGFLQCACKFTESLNADKNQRSRSKRLETKEIIKMLKKTNPSVEANIFKSTENVMLDTLISYKKDGLRHSFLDDYDILP